MNKKTLTRLMIIAVAGLWGYNIYRTVGNYSIEETAEKTAAFSAISFSPLNFRKDSFILELPKVDPFLKNQRYVATSSNNLGLTQGQSAGTGENSRNPLPKPPKPVTQWPNIKYYGFVRNHSGSKPLLMIGVNSKTYKAKVGSELDDLLLQSATRDSVTVLFNKEVRRFGKG